MISSLSPRNRYLISVIIFNFFGLGLGAIVIGSFLPMMREDYALSYSFTGILVSVYNLGNIGIGLFSGLLAILFHRKPCYLVLTIMTASGFVLMLMTKEPVLLLSAFLMVGLARGAGVNYGNGAVTELSKENASLLNLVNAMFALGALLAPFLLLGFDTISAHGWRLTVWVVVVIGMISAVSMIPMKLDDAPSESGRSADFGFLHSRLFWLTVAFSFCYMSVEASVFGWLVSFFTDSGVASESFSLVLNGIFWVSILIGRFLCSALSARLSAPRLLLVLSTGMLLFFAFLMLCHTLLLMILATIGFGLSVSGMYATAIANTGEICRRYPFALGFYTTFAGIGGIITPSIIGILADWFGIRNGMLLLFLPLLFQLFFVIVNERSGLTEQASQTEPVFCSE